MPTWQHTDRHDEETSSVQAGYDWGGLGVRVEARGFQWNNPLVRDALFRKLIESFF